MKPILAPTDFSGISVNACHYAAALAADLATDLILVHVQPLPLVISDIPLPYENYEITLEEAGLKMNKLEAALQEQLPAPLRCSGQVLSGELIHQMKGLIRDRQPLLVVMGKRGTGATEAFFMGSHTRAAVRQLEWPLLVVPEQASFHKIRNVVFACDMKRVRETVPFPIILHFVNLFKAGLDILHISDTGEASPSLLPESKYIQNKLGALNPEIHFISNKDITAGFDDFIRLHDSDLLMLVPKKHGIWDTLFHGSTATKALTQPVIPLLMLPDQS